MNKHIVDVVIVGDLAYDLTITPKKTKKVIAGAAYNASVAASLVAKKGTVGVVAKIGDDFAPGITALQKRGIDLQGLFQVKGGRTPLFTIREYPDNRRKLSAKLGVSATASPEIFPKAYLSARHIHLASSNPKKYVKWIPYLRKTLPKTTTLSVDGNDFFLDEVKTIKKAFELVDMIFVNELELATVQNAFPDFALTKPTILKKGGKGAVYIDKAKKVEFFVKAPKVKVVDTTGAGDTLAGVFLAKRMQGVSSEQALQTAVHFASQAVTDFGVDHLLKRVKKS